MTTRQLGFLMKLLTIKREILELKDFCKENLIVTELADRIALDAKELNHELEFYFANRVKKEI